MCPKCPSLTPEILLSRNKEWQQTLSTDHPTFFADSISGELKPDVRHHRSIAIFTLIYAR